VKSLEGFRDRARVEVLARALSDEARGLAPMTFMEVCGTHTMAVARSGLHDFLPENVELLSGPGCPVCVTPNAYLDRAVALGRLEDVCITTFGDLVRVPGSSSSLEAERARGRDVRVVYSPTDALALAREHPERRVVFLAVGFETTAPAIAATVSRAAAEGVANFLVLTAHKTIPGPMALLAQGALEGAQAEGEPAPRLSGFICPGHVSVIIGAAAYEDLAREQGMPCVVTGFEPVDIMQGLLMLARQMRRGEARVEVQYSRVVKLEGNPTAQALVDRVFRPADAEWRGVGVIPESGLVLRDEFAAHDAGRIPVEVEPVLEHPGCICGLILQGRRRPTDCSLFGAACTPEDPVGPCMVSSEGTCAAYYHYRR